jgi:hypothetical protein
MGLKLRGVLRCGRCGKPRGLVTHTCTTTRPRNRRTRVQSPVTWECGNCHKPRGLIHTCVTKTDFKKRKRAAARKAATAARRRQREAARARQAARRKATRERQAARRRQAAAERRARARTRRQTAAAGTRPSRPRGGSHEPGTCGDRDCPKYGCKAYFQGMADCPGPHGEGGG